MRWEDENYAQLYTRDTPTWLTWPWQARCLLPLLIRKVDGAGLMELGPMGRDALPIVLGIPMEVIAPGLAALEASGTIAWHGNTLEVPKFLEAQEARKTEAQKKRDQRSRARDQLRAQTIRTTGAPCPPMSPVVPRCPPMSLAVPLQPCPALLSPALPLVLSTSSTVAAEEERPGNSTALPMPEQESLPVRTKKPKPEKQTDPRHAPLVKALCDAYQSVRGKPYGFTARDARAVTELLKLGEPDEVVARWRRALLFAGYRKKLSAIYELASGAEWNFYAVDQPTGASNGKSPIRAETQEHGEPGDGTEEFLNAFRT